MIKGEENCVKDWSLSPEEEEEEEECHQNNQQRRDVCINVQCVSNGDIQKMG